MVRSMEDQILVPQHQGDEIDISDKQSADDRNTGFAVVVPWERLLEMTETEWLRNDMNIGIDQLIRDKGGRPAGLAPPLLSPSPDASIGTASVEKPSSPVDADENPRHREDFTSLLNAAAKTKPQGD